MTFLLVGDTFSGEDGLVLLVEMQMSWYTAITVVAITVCGGVLVLRGARLPGSGRDVPEITATELRQRQLEFEARLQQARIDGLQEPISGFILVDVRSPEETQVSVIPNALTVEQFESIPDSFRERTVICYCTIGVRSEKFARNLRHDGINAWNFKGSILEWCKHHYPLVDLNGHSTGQVHTWSGAYSVPSDYEAVW